MVLAANVFSAFGRGQAFRGGETDEYRFSPQLDRIDVDRTRNGPVAPSSQLTLPVPDDILYEVVDGKIVEKNVGATEIVIAYILNQHLGMFARTHRLGRE